jgi:hypothetical protein
VTSWVAFYPGQSLWSRVEVSRKLVALIRTACLGGVFPRGSGQPTVPLTVELTVVAESQGHPLPKWHTWMFARSAIILLQTPQQSWFLSGGHFDGLDGNC